MKKVVRWNTLYPLKEQTVCNDVLLRLDDRLPECDRSCLSESLGGVFSMNMASRSTLIIVFWTDEVIAV